MRSSYSSTNNFNGNSTSLSAWIDKEYDVGYPRFSNVEQEPPPRRKLARVEYTKLTKVPMPLKRRKATDKRTKRTVKPKRKTVKRLYKKGTKRPATDDLNPKRTRIQNPQQNIMRRLAEEFKSIVRGGKSRNPVFRNRKIEEPPIYIDEASKVPVSDEEAEISDIGEYEAEISDIDEFPAISDDDDDIGSDDEEDSGSEDDFPQRFLSAIEKGKAAKRNLEIDKKKRKMRE